MKGPTQCRAFLLSSVDSPFLVIELVDGLPATGLLTCLVGSHAARTIVTRVVVADILPPD